jgi:hypothetical protein
MNLNARGNAANGVFGKISDTITAPAFLAACGVYLENINSGDAVKPVVVKL